MQISIIGGSIAGLSFIKKGIKNKLHKDNNLTLFEKDIKKDKPCSQIITNEINKLTKLKKNEIKNKIKTYKIFAPNGKYIEINLKNPDYIINRKQFKQNIIKEIEKKIEIKDNHQLQSINNNKLTFITNNNKIIQKKYKKNTTTQHYNSSKTIIATGNNLKLKKQLNLKQNNNYTAIKAIVNKKNKNLNEIKTYPYIKTFAWEIPINENKTEIGIMAKTNPIQKFNLLKSKLNIKSSRYRYNINNTKKNSTFIETKTQAATIPIFNPLQKLEQKLKNNHLYYIGDFATHTKATTGGGIIQSIKDAKILANSIKNKTSYTTNSRKEHILELTTHKVLANKIESLSNKQLNNFIKDFNNKKIKKILQNINRDNTFKIGVKLLLNKPNLIKYLF
jgi:flavin-dependent dehydrogenase